MQGRDHVWLAPHDEGACCFPTDIYQLSIILTHWGRTDPDHSSNTAFAADNYSQPWVDPAHKGYENVSWTELIKGHPCYTPGKVGGWVASMLLAWLGGCWQHDSGRVCLHTHSSGSLPTAKQQHPAVCPAGLSCPPSNAAATPSYSGASLVVGCASCCEVGPPMQKSTTSTAVCLAGVSCLAGPGNPFPQIPAPLPLVAPPGCTSSASRHAAVLQGGRGRETNTQLQQGHPAAAACAGADARVEETGCEDWDERRGGRRLQ